MERGCRRVTTLSLLFGLQDLVEWHMALLAADRVLRFRRVLTITQCVLCQT